MAVAHLPKTDKAPGGTELVRKELEEASTQEANVGKKTVIWKVREYWGFRWLNYLKDPYLDH